MTEEVVGVIAPLECETRKRMCFSVRKEPASCWCGPRWSLLVTSLLLLSPSCGGSIGGVARGAGRREPWHVGRGGKSTKDSSVLSWNCWRPPRFSHRSVCSNALRITVWTFSFDQYASRWWRGFPKNASRTASRTRSWRTRTSFKTTAV